MMLGEEENFNQIRIASLFTYTLLTIIPVITKLASARALSNIEFNTRAFRKLKYYSIIDAVSLVLFVPLLFIESQCVFKKWFKSNYWLIVYKYYIILFLWRSLTTLNSMINLSIVCNQFRDLKNYKITGTWFNIILFTSMVLFSIFFHLPNLLFYEINFKEKNSTHENDFYFLISSNVKYYRLYNLIDYTISFLILIITVIINSLVSFQIKKKQSERFESVIYVSNKKATKNLSNGKDKRAFINDHDSCHLSHSVIFKPISSQHSTNDHRNCLDTQTKTSIVWIIFAFSVDNLFKTSFTFISLFFEQNTIITLSIMLTFFTSILFTQLLHFIIYYKYNEAFSQRIKKIFHLN
jgi:hypothetical protein